ncbi:MAG: DUF2334 domain-containing protein [Novosphingobium sp.]|nr:DUF2334 domain-containing protein [Novosphingobium sp.]
MNRSLLFSIHDVGPRFESEVDELIDHVSRYVPLNKLAMLVVPDHWGANPIAHGSPFAAKLSRWAQAGVQMFAHGFFHMDDHDHARLTSRFKAKFMTASEGEFLGLDYVMAHRRIVASRARIESLTGRQISGFVAPAWLYGKPTLKALHETGILLAEDHMKVWSPRTGVTLARGPVITWASRSKARIASSLAVGRVLPPILRFTPTIRVAVHPGDAHVPALMASIDSVLRRVTRTHTPATYEDLLGAG